MCVCKREREKERKTGEGGGIVHHVTVKLVSEGQFLFKLFMSKVNANSTYQLFPYKKLFLLHTAVLSHPVAFFPLIWWNVYLFITLCLKAYCNDFSFGGRVKVDFFKVDTHFWRVDLGRNWISRLRSTRFDYVIYVDTEQWALCRHVLTWIIRSTSSNELYVDTFWLGL